MSIKCRAYDCKHNNNIGECFANNINIKGKQAQTTRDTMCGSYDYFSPSISNASFEFASELMWNNPNLSTEIRCSAEKCKHNQGKVCKAGAIEINQIDTSCETFEQ